MSDEFNPADFIEASGPGTFFEPERTLADLDGPSIPVKLMCVGCGKTPDELPAYSKEFTGEDSTPNEYVWENEGTLNVENGHFLCDDCYIKAGMPSGPNGWVCP